MAIQKLTVDALANNTITDSVIADDSIDIEKLSNVNLNIAPEILEIQVDAPDAGQDTMWKWTWLQSTLPYARRTITNSPEVNVPLYKQGTYTVNNFAAYDIHGNMSQTHSLYLKWVDGAGTDNLVSWATSAGPISDTHPDINGGNATDVQRISVNVPSTITPPSLTNPSVSYTVVNSGSGSYTFSGAASGDNPNLGPFYRGGTYTINITASGHPFYFTTDNGTNFAAGTYFGEYTSGVTGSRTDSGTITFTVPAGAPDTLYYQCGNHSAMRGAITVKDLAVETNINGNYVVYFQHTQEGHKTPIELRPIPSLVNQMCIVYDASSGQFVPQDLSTYVENTPSFENKIREVAGTAELVVEDGSAVVAKVNVYADSTYLPLVGNNAGDQAFATDTDKLYIWDGSAWQLAGAASTDELAEGSTNLYYTNARVSSYLSSNDFDTATNIVASITDSAPSTLDTLNELAAALGDDPNFATTVTNSIATKVATADFNSLWDTRFASDSTTNLSEGTNLYYTDARVDARITKTAIDALNVDADTLDSLNSTQFLRSDTNSNLTSGYIRFYDNNIEYGRLYANGNLAIGTTTPTYEIEIRDNAGGDLVNIDRTNGRVGINGPAYFPLNVTNNVDGTISRWRRDGGTNNPLVEIELSDTNNAGYIVQSGSNTGDLGFKIGSDIKLMLKNNGYFGIGTSSPVAGLDVANGAGYFTSFNNPTGSGRSGLEVGWDGTKSVLQSYDRVNNTFERITYNGSSHTFLNGYVGIGTDNPSTGLELSGAGNTTRIKLINGSDQVNFGLWDGSNYRMEGDANRPILITSYHSDGIKLGGSGSTNLQIKDGRVTSPTDPAISFAPGGVTTSGFKVYEQNAPWAENAGNNWPVMQTSVFTAHMNGTLRIRANMYIQSGTYYFKWRIKDQSSGTVLWDSYFDGGQAFNDYEYPAGQSGNVHTPKYYVFDVPGFLAGQRYCLEMSASTSGGDAAYQNASQTLYLKEFSVMAQGTHASLQTVSRLKVPRYNTPTPANNTSTSAVLTQASGLNTHLNYGVHEKYLGAVQFRANGSYLDFKTNLNSNSYMFYMICTGYLYNDGLYNHAMRGGYMYTNNSVINQHTSTPSGSDAWYNFYRDSSGRLCGKLNKGQNGYTEGKVHLYFGTFDSNDTGVYITDVVMSNTTSNIF